MNPNQLPNAGAQPYQNTNPYTHSRPGSYVAPQAQPSVVSPDHVAEIPEFKHSSPGKTIAIVILTLTTITFVGLFAWMFVRWTDASTNLNTKIDNAVAIAVNDNEEKMEAEIAEREKSPSYTFSGPEDYGNLSFPYPKTWSLYVEKDASNGGDYIAYFNPGGVNPIGKETVCALRVTISTTTTEKVISDYQRYVDRGEMTVSVIKVNGGSTTANIYEGELPSGLLGSVAVIRDKTAIVQTDSVEVFSGDFNRIISALTFNS